MSIIIRRSEPSDAEALQAIYKEAGLYTNTLQLPMPSIDMWQKRMVEVPSNVHSMVAIIDNEVVGNLALTVSTNERRRHVASFGVSVKVASQGQGVGKALIAAAIDLADNWLNLRRLEITVFTDNEGAIALYKKMGFVIEGELVDFAFRNGEYVNAYQMARIRPNN